VIVRQLLCVCALCTVMPAQATALWTYVDAQGVTHIGNVSPPNTRQIEWLAGKPSRPSFRQTGADGAAPHRWPRYAEVRPLLEAAARMHDVDPALVTAVAAAESGFNANAVSRKGALGLMQIMPDTGARYGLGTDKRLVSDALVQNPGLNAQIGANYLADLLRQFNGELELAVAAYNAGEGAVLRHGKKVPPYPETQQYVSNVIQLYNKFGPLKP